MPRKKKISPPPRPIECSTLNEFNQESDYPRPTKQPEHKKSWWSLKLEDRRWQQKRNRILERDNYTCRSCQDERDTSQLHVHHRYYKFRADPWDYPDDALLTLCKKCHKSAAEDNAAFDATLKTYFRPDDLWTMASIICQFKDGKIPPYILIYVLQKILCDTDLFASILNSLINEADANGWTGQAATIRHWIKEMSN